MKKILLISFISLFFLSIINLVATSNQFITNSQLKQVKNKYGNRAQKRVELWDKMLQKNQNEKILYKLKNVNDFFNKIKYKTDPKHWRKKDYWQRLLSLWVQGQEIVKTLLLLNILV